MCHLKINLKALTLLIFSINNVTIKKWSAKCSELSPILTKELAYCPQICIYKEYGQKATYTSNKDTEHGTDTCLTHKKICLLHTVQLQGSVEQEGCASGRQQGRI